MAEYARCDGIPFDAYGSIFCVEDPVTFVPACVDCEITSDTFYIVCRTDSGPIPQAPNALCYGYTGSGFVTGIPAVEATLMQELQISEISDLFSAGLITIVIGVGLKFLFRTMNFARR